MFGDLLVIIVSFKNCLGSVENTLGSYNMRFNY